MYCPDVSHYHPVADWDAVSAPFLIGKATEGTGFVDPTLDDFVAGCEARGIPYWLYAFLDRGDERAQAEFLISVGGGRTGENFVGYALDAEAGNDPAEVQKALDTVAATGKCMLYTGYCDFDDLADVIASRPDCCAWWEARYGVDDGADNSAKYPCHDGADLHQFTSCGTAAGISGLCDLNRLTGAREESWFTDRQGAKSLLSVDGRIGPATVTRLQEVLATPADGRIDGQSASDQKYYPAVLSSVCGWTGGTSTVVFALQKKVGVTSDGLLGPKTAKGLQTFLIGAGFSCGASGADGIVGEESAKALQRWLNEA